MTDTEALRDFSVPGLLSGDLPKPLKIGGHQTVVLDLGFKLLNITWPPHLYTGLQPHFQIRVNNYTHPFLTGQNIIIPQNLGSNLRLRIRNSLPYPMVLKTKNFFIIQPIMAPKIKILTRHLTPSSSSQQKSNKRKYG